MNDIALVRLGAAQAALAECKTAMEAKQIADVAEAARVYLKRTNASTETVNRATEVRLLAERQMGEFLKVMGKNKGGRPSKTPCATTGVSTLAEIGISETQSRVAQVLADIPVAEFRERVAVITANGGHLTPAAVAGFSATAKAAGEQAGGDSENLWRLKSAWDRATKRDRAAFLHWIKTTTPTDI